ncbi:glycosyltransferase family 4 protein [Vibrio sp. Vb1018]|uniref:glycosyltransferase family 4 protein n=1 Tax=Vibrio sp. Vb1018 TaxID=3074636 RepID=UPI0029643192|nr:glycosyltransferase family 4 protein [Vibrio sp. Vb1018]MDW1821127.1 glycosyltransferase family 4 protein [Vibrio sp. Vb1018]
MKVIVAQIGARRRYLVAKILANESMLEALYTDSSNYSFLGKMAKKCNFKTGRLGRLAKRIINDIPINLVQSTDKLVISDVSSKLILKASQKHKLSKHEVFSKVLINWGCRNADAVYAMQDESHEFLLYAKAKGLKIILDTCVTPLALRKVRDRQRRFQGWESEISDREISKFEHQFLRNLKIADLILCPSKVVAEDVKLLSRTPDNRLKIVPYGSSITLGNNNPIIGNVLFVGSGDVRKGIHVISKVAEMARKNNKKFDFRIVGEVDDKIINKAESRCLNFMGKLSKDELIKEYGKADVFIFPTCAEGLAGSVLEALAHGLPIITTKASGLLIKDKVEGIYIDEDNVDALFLEICNLIENRNFRNTIANNAKQRFDYYTIESYSTRLIEAIK